MNEEVEELIENSNRPPADRTMPYIQAADCLEMLGTNRADFRHVSDNKELHEKFRIEDLDDLILVGDDAEMLSVVGAKTRKKWMQSAREIRDNRKV